MITRHFVLMQMLTSHSLVYVKWRVLLRFDKMLSSDLPSSRQGFDNNNSNKIYTGQQQHWWWRINQVKKSTAHTLSNLLTMARYSSSKCRIPSKHKGNSSFRLCSCVLKQNP